MNSRELAEQLGVSEATVSRLLSDERRPSVDLMFKVRDTLLWTLDEQGQALQAGTYGDDLGRLMSRQEAS